MIPVKRTNIRLVPDPRKVVLRFLDFGDADRFEPVVEHVMRLEDIAVENALKEILAAFQHRHSGLKAVFLESYEKLSSFVSGDPSLSRKFLIGAYFTHEYSIGAAALFNPSIVPHPDQRNLKDGELRFIMSLRATGEGHISSIAFQTGIITADGETQLDLSVPKLTCGQRKVTVSSVREDSERISEGSYELAFPKDSAISSRVIFPYSPAESNGMEDARFVRFADGAETKYLGTYTAYNGKTIRPHLIETRDFQHFSIRPFSGKAARGKGMALFPEKINSKFAMIGRQGGRSLSIMYSDDLNEWETYQPLQQPQRGWEILQMGNCGSPVKTPHGWLLLTHAVGPMRTYVLSCSLLDLHQPEIVLASLNQPLLSPNAEEREGYVPNVLYTCGLLQHHENLIIPYAMSDQAISFAVVKTEAVIREMGIKGSYARKSPENKAG